LGEISNRSELEETQQVTVTDEQQAEQAGGGGRAPKPKQ